MTSRQVDTKISRPWWHDMEYPTFGSLDNFRLRVEMAILDVLRRGAR